MAGILRPARPQQVVQQPATGLNIQTSDYGNPIPIVFGRNRVAVNVLQYLDFVTIPHYQQQQGGKGGGGGGGVSSYTYEAAVMLGICEGPINGIEAVWIDKNYDRSSIYPQTAGVGYSLTETFTVDSDASTTSRGLINLPKVNNATIGNVASISIKSMSSWPNTRTYLQALPASDISHITQYQVAVPPQYIGMLAIVTYTVVPTVTVNAKFTKFLGSYPQAAWSYMTSQHPDIALGYEGIAYLAGQNYVLGTGAQLQNHSVDVIGFHPLNASAGIFDAAPDDVITELLTNADFGAGYPASGIGSWTQYRDYCLAFNLLISPIYKTQETAATLVQRILDITNSGGFFSEGLLKIVPYGDVAATGNGATYTPNTSPIYSLTDDDYVTTGTENPVSVKYKTPADRFNKVQVDFLDMTNNFNSATVYADDLADIEVNGLRPASPLTASEIADPMVARMVAQIHLQRQLYIVGEYTFSLGWRFCLLEPGDYVLLNDSNLGFVDKAVRITAVEENGDGIFTFTAEDAPPNVLHSEIYPSSAGIPQSAANLNALPGNANPPVIFEPPAQLLSGPNDEIWIGANGGDNWGGAEVYASLDGTSYQDKGTVSGPSRTGTTSDTLASGASVDTVNTVTVNIGTSGTLSSISSTAWNGYGNLCCIGDEVISFQTATLISTGVYQLSGLRRGLYGSAISAHDAGSKFMMLDSSVAKVQVPFNYVGNTLDFKIASYNTIGTEQQALSDITAYQYQLRGVALDSAPADVTGLVATYRASFAEIAWQPVTDVRTVDFYEVRFGTSWNTAKVIGKTKGNSFTVSQPGSYLVCAYAGRAYSVTPASVQVLASATFGEAFVKNVITTYDDAANGWIGAYTPYAYNDPFAGTVELGGVGLISEIVSFADVPSIYYWGGVGASGEYESAQPVTLSSPAACNVRAQLNATVESPYSLVSSWQSISALPSIIGANANLADAILQHAIDPDGTGYGAWENHTDGTQLFKSIKFRALLSSSDPTITPVVTGMSYAIDVPDRDETQNGVVLSSSGVTHFAYTTPFMAVPNLQVTVTDLLTTDQVQITNETASGFDIAVLNGATYEARTVNIRAQGY